MAYDNPLRRTYHFDGVDFGTGSDITHVIPVPDSRRGRVTAVFISDITEDFAGSTSDAGVQVGDGSDADKYYDTGLVLDETFDIGEELQYLADDGSKVDIEADRTTITVTFVSSVGTPTGIASIAVEVEWF